MAPKAQPTRLPAIRKPTPRAPVIGVFAPADPRIDEKSRSRAQNIVKMTAETLTGRVTLPDKSPVPVVYSDILVDSEPQADAVAQQFQKAAVDILVCVPDTWAFPQLTTITLLSRFPTNTPINITCGNSGPKPGVVYAHALNGALAQSGKLAALNVGKWPDTGQNPKMTPETADALIDWCYAAITAVALRGRRVVIFGHDSMGMETALAHVIPTRNTFGIEITRLDMKLLADMVAKKACNQKELQSLRRWFDRYVGKRIEIRDDADSERFNQSLALYLIVRDIMNDLSAVGGGFMSQLEWGSDLRATPLPVADPMESLFNSTFDHTGKKPPTPYATEADTQGLLTMLIMTWLSGGNPPLFMDFRKVWQPDEIKQLAKSIGLKKLDKKADWYTRGVVDGDNSGSASFDWAGRPGEPVKKLMSRVTMPLADPDYFPGGGNSVTFITPGGIKGIAARLAYSATSGLFSIIWDTAHTTNLPADLTRAMCNLTNWNWPHTFVVPEHATMTEYKQYPPANHLHMTWNLPPRRLQHYMDLTGVLNVTPWAARAPYIEGVDRPLPLAYLLNGGENNYKKLTAPH